MRWLRLGTLGVVVALIAAVAGVSTAEASKKTDDFIASLVKAAQKNEKKTGIPASVAIGMAALETGWGGSKMTGEYVVDEGLPTEKTYQVNTLFNIKCTSTPSPHQTGCVPVRTAEYRKDGTKYYIVDEFRTYASWGDSLLDYGRLLTSLSRYASAFEYTDYPDQFVIQVHRGGYATDPTYATTVIGIMKKYDLYRYNVSGAGPGTPKGAPPALKPSPKPTPTPSATPKPTATPTATPTTTAAPKPTPTKTTAAPNPTPTKTTAKPTPKPTKPATKKSAYPELKKGSRGASVVTLQALLNARNKAGLVRDGVFGQRTEKAVKAFQKKSKLKVTGKLNDATWAKLLPVLKPGQKGASVKAAQVELRAAGAKVTLTSKMDKKTVKAVKAFQKKNRITTTGNVAQLTWAALLKK
jgi:flagellum-specific peptidoglycan hydrolase FlgJ/peptidoglycan hydrolase-like protein with peptidoglycan-binding domain